MRRAAAILLVIVGLGMIVTGIWKFIPPFDTSRFLPHINSSSFFIVIAVFHIWLNRKSLARYFKGLGWWWVPVVILITTNVIWLGIVLPIITS